jgi:uncharacterized membrane protein
MEYQEKKHVRIWELDFFRGIALIFMIYFHTVYDLKEFYYWPISYETGINFYIGKLSAILFILISGVSTHLSKNTVKRGLRVLLYAMVLTVVSHLFNPYYGVKFGILHFLGLSMIISPLFKNINKYLQIIIGIVIISFGDFMVHISTPYTFLFPLGIMGPGFLSSDYYPLIPWLGVFLIGMSLGKFLYTNKRSLFSFTLEDNLISKAGQNTLIIYLIHQPTIYGILMLIKYLFRF